jgi:hypothetical protein
MILLKMLQSATIFLHGWVEAQYATRMKPGSPSPGSLRTP